MKQVFKTLLADFHARPLPEFISRDICIPLHSGKIVSLIGSRRSGKTYLMYELMSMIEDKTSIVYINFEDDRLELDAKQLHLLLDAYLELYPRKKKIYFFFDEIQEVPGWEKFVRRIYDTVSKNVFTTGSSAKLLSKEIATSLRGRTITYPVYPLSFKEYLSFKKVRVSDTTRSKALVSSSFDNYLLSGGFPEVVLSENLSEKILADYFDVMLYRDIVERHDVANTLLLKLFLKRLLSNTSKEFSVNKLYNSFKSKGLKVSKDSLYSYLDYAEDAYLLFTLSNFSESFNRRTLKKSYSIDNGLSRLLSLSLDKDFGRLFENAVFLELKRREKDVYYHVNDFECDFVVKEKDRVTGALQVCYTLTSENEERELKGLRSAMKRFNLKKGTLLTKDQEKIIGSIKVVPAVKWFLNY